MTDVAVSADIACTRCGYNLRGLSLDGQCPECGTLVAEALRERIVARPRWFRKVSNGARLIEAGTLLATAAFILAIFGRGFFLLLPVAAIVGAAGAWRLASLPPRAAGKSPGRALSVMARVAAIALALAQFNALIMLSKILSRRYSVSWTDLDLALAIMLLAWAAAWLLALLVAARVAREVHDREGTLFARVLAVLEPAIVLVMTAAEVAASRSIYIPPMLDGCLIVAGLIGAMLHTVYFAALATKLSRHG